MRVEFDKLLSHELHYLMFHVTRPDCLLARVQTGAIMGRYNNNSTCEFKGCKQFIGFSRSMWSARSSRRPPSVSSTGSGGRAPGTSTRSMRSRSCSVPRCLLVKVIYLCCLFYYVVIFGSTNFKENRKFQLIP